MMKRPRNRQPRDDRQNQRGRPNHASSARGSPAQRPARSQTYQTVPNLTQVIPGASVSIVLKEDQPTGRETQGQIQDVLTNGNHPRGIKVRLRDGRVGRVQRMINGEEVEGETGTAASGATKPASRFSSRYHDVRNDDDYPDEPPPRSLADFLPTEATSKMVESPAVANGQDIVNCPFCDSFEGDEAAVTHHIDQQHLT